MQQIIRHTYYMLTLILTLIRVGFLGVRFVVEG